MKNTYAFIARQLKAVNTVYYILLVYLIAGVSSGTYKNQDLLIQKDEKSGFSYLHGILYHDSKLDKSEYIFRDLKLYVPQVYENGMSGPGNSYIQSAFYSPFYFLASIASKKLDYNRNGVSLPYRVFMLLGSLFYLVSGLYFIYRILTSLEFDIWLSSATVFLMGISPFALQFLDEPFSQNILFFFLTSVFIYHTIVWHRERSRVSMTLLALSLTALCFIHLWSIVLVLFFIRYNRLTFKEAGVKALSVTEILITGTMVIVVLVPQLYFNKQIFGSLTGPPAWPTEKWAVLPLIREFIQSPGMINLLLFLLLPISFGITCLNGYRSNLRTNFIIPTVLTLISCVLLLQKADCEPGMVVGFFPVCSVFYAGFLEKVSRSDNLGPLVISMSVMSLIFFLWI